MNILLGITGSVSAKLFTKLTDLFLKDGNNVKIIFTPSALKMLNVESEIDYNSSNETFSFWNYINLNHIEYITDWDNFEKYHKNNEEIVHINLAKWADKFVIAPASANTIAKIAYGMADNVLLETALAWNKILYIAPAMNCEMYANNITQRNIAELESRGHIFIQPTVKKLACGDFGIGALAHVKTIHNIVNGHRWEIPVSQFYLMDYENSFPNFSDYIPKFNEPGSFGFQRKHEIHNGVDIYCVDGSPVHAVEDGEVIGIKQFTGKKLGMDWWLDTWAILVKGKSGVVCYGELNERLPFGKFVKAKDFIGNVKAVLKPDKLRTDIRNHNTAMLHLQLFTDYKDDEQLLNWYPNQERNKLLLDPTPYLHLSEQEKLQTTNNRALEIAQQG